MTPNESFQPTALGGSRSAHTLRWHGLPLPSLGGLTQASGKKKLMRLTAVRADITTLDVEAIVNAANSSLLGGGGVDGAIHRAAGPELVQDCRLLHGCKTGQSKTTGGYRLPARFIIHTVGPVWNGGTGDEAKLLASCYASAIGEAERIGARTLAFPCISTGIYGYPPVEAARIAVQTVRDSGSDLEEVVFCCFSESDLKIYQSLLSHVA